MGCIKSIVSKPPTIFTSSEMAADVRIAWTALEAEGFGASLQHFHFAPAVVGYMSMVPNWLRPKMSL